MNLEITVTLKFALIKIKAFNAYIYAKLTEKQA
jgi:hypothetical protein